MPNIEMYGFDEGDLMNWYEELRSAFKHAAYAEDVVITGVRSGVYSLAGRNDKRPFFRVCITQKYVAKHLLDIKKRMAPLGVDVEVLVLAEFISKS